MAPRREDKFAVVLIRRSEDVAALINKLSRLRERVSERGRVEIAIVINMRVFKYQFATGEPTTEQSRRRVQKAGPG